jgi:hypothetical protein
VLIHSTKYPHSPVFSMLCPRIKDTARIHEYFGAVLNCVFFAPVSGLDQEVSREGLLGQKLCGESEFPNG